MIYEEDNQQWVGFDFEEHLYANLGPARIPHHHRAILGYCREFGVELEVFTNDNRAALFHHQDHFEGQPVTARRMMTDARGYIAELLAKAVGRNTLDAELTSEDKELLLNMLRGYGGLNADDLYMGSGRGGYLGDYVQTGLGLSADVHVPLDLSDLLQSGFLDYQLHFSQFLNQNPTLFHPLAGWTPLSMPSKNASGISSNIGARLRRFCRPQAAHRLFIVTTVGHPKPLMRTLRSVLSPPQS